MSLPSVKPNMCSVSTSPFLSARLPAAPNAGLPSPSTANKTSTITQSAPSGALFKARTGRQCGDIERHPVAIQNACPRPRRVQDDLDERRGLRRPFEQDRIDACERAQRRRSQRRRDEREDSFRHRQRNDSRQVVMQDAAFILNVRNTVTVVAVTVKCAAMMDLGRGGLAFEYVHGVV